MKKRRFKISAEYQEGGFGFGLLICWGDLRGLGGWAGPFLFKIGTQEIWTDDWWKVSDVPKTL